MSLFASKQSVSKVIVKINEDRRAEMIDELGLDSIVSAKTATADAILGYVRARRNSQCSANVETMYQLLEEGGGTGIYCRSKRSIREYL